MTFGLKGAAAGVMYASAIARAEDQGRALADLRKRVLEAEKRVIFRKAARQAATEVMEEIVEEIATGKEMRLSDPANVAVRNDVYVEKMDKYVRLSAGSEKAKMTPELKAEFKARKTMK